MNFIDYHDIFIYHGRKKRYTSQSVDFSLKNEFRTLCVRKGKTLTEEIQRLMKEELEKEKKK
jgi:hypothetical protein